MNHNKFDKEDLATEALIALLFRKEELSLEQAEIIAQEYEGKEIKLTPKMKKALRIIGNDIFNVPAILKEQDDVPTMKHEYSDACMAMDRNNSSGKIDDFTKTEMEKRRAALLEKLRNKINRDKLQNG